jgi:prepilin peptidase CpaA
MPIEQYREVVLLLMVCIAAINDLTTRRIPNRLLLITLGCAVILNACSLDPVHELSQASLGMALGFGMFLPFYLVRGMAAGDVKMMAVVGAFTGPVDAFHIAILTFCTGGVMALLLLLKNGRARAIFVNVGRMLAGSLIPGMRASALTPENSAGFMPYGPAIAIGTIAVLIGHYG